MNKNSNKRECGFLSTKEVTLIYKHRTYFSYLVYVSTWRTKQLEQRNYI